MVALLWTRIRLALIVKYSFTIFMHTFLFAVHMATLETSTLTFATITKTCGEMYFLIVFMVIFNIMVILKSAKCTVSLRQSNQEIQRDNKCKRYEKLLKWIHSGFCILIETYSIVQFILKYNLIYQHFTSLTERWIEGENICKVLSYDVVNNKYIKKLKKSVKDTTITNFLVLSASIFINFATSEFTIIETIKYYGLAMHHAIAFIALKKPLLLPLSIIKKLPLDTNYTAFDIKPDDLPDFRVLTKQEDTTEDYNQYNDGSYDTTQQLCLFPLYQSSQIPPYILKHYIYMKQQASFASLQYSPSLLQYHCSFEQPSINMSKNSQCFSCHSMARPKNLLAINANVNARQYIYQMKSKPHGICIIINNENFKTLLKSRSGTNKDAHNLQNLFNYLGFVTQCHNNKTHIEMRQILNDVASMDHSKYDCLMVAILTHGDYGDLLYGTSGQGIMIQEVIETFSGRRCPALIGKPKIFIIQACRGTRHNQVVWLNDTNDDECDMTDSHPTVHPNISDYLVAHSTIPGHVSFRNNKIGSIFISTLVEIFKRCAAYEDIITMLERVTNEVTKYKPQGDGLQDSRQSPEVHSCLRGKLYFNPGNYN